MCLSQAARSSGNITGQLESVMEDSVYPQDPDSSPMAADMLSLNTHVIGSIVVRKLKLNSKRLRIEGLISPNCQWDE